MFDARRMTIHGYRVLAWILTEENGWGYVLVEIPKKNGMEWVVAHYQSGDEEWSSGYYFNDKDKAARGLLERAGLIKEKA